ALSPTKSSSILTSHGPPDMGVIVASLRATITVGFYEELAHAKPGFDWLAQILGRCALIGHGRFFGALYSFSQTTRRVLSHAFFYHHFINQRQTTLYNG